MNKIAELTGQDLSRKVAKELGWASIQEREQWIEDYDVYEPTTVLIGIAPGTNHHVKIEFATNTDQAFTLTVPGWLLTVNEWPSADGLTWRALYVQSPIQPSGVKSVGEIGNTPAEAICRARLALKERMGV